MRSSRRDQIIEVAIALIADHGVEALSFEGLAEASGVSKSGILYHFPSRHALLLGIQEHFVHAWEEDLVRIAGAPASALTPAQRLRAVVLSMGTTPDRAQLRVVLEADSHPDFAALWAAVDRQWMPEPDSEYYPVLLMSYGLWLHDHAHHRPLTASERDALVAATLARIPETP